ncbi:MAG TPA: hypothetical protein HA264_04430 [Methanolinea sp.]|jgi:hypothetical protein|nr:MAG: hypothetical protein A4E36_00866 [Methanoregulaceae archaeon PtaB.Bin009]OPY41872.1 MAG: hypothetical protein A4E41_00691 [Methanoregulaceae archaeon PtaU1.Bin066]HII76286.1 hypothetical protein [Methanolinea sp.]HNS82486.1 hypothetical protein [Methanolinea sp.]
MHDTFLAANRIKREPSSDILILSHWNFDAWKSVCKMELDGKTVIGAGVVLFVIVVGIWYMFLR